MVATPGFIVYSLNTGSHCISLAETPGLNVCGLSTGSNTLGIIMVKWLEPGTTGLTAHSTQQYGWNPGSHDDVWLECADLLSLTLYNDG